MPELLVLARTMRLYTMDAWVSDPEVLTDESRLRDALRAGARAGGATVLDETFCVFSNGAVTGVLVLAQSHLSLHTWPELSLANVDLLSYGDVHAQRRFRLIVPADSGERTVSAPHQDAPDLEAGDRSAFAILPHAADPYRGRKMSGDDVDVQAATDPPAGEDREGHDG